MLDMTLIERVASDAGSPAYMQEMAKRLAEIRAQELGV